MKYRLFLVLSWLNLLRARAWSAFWPALSALSVYAALALLDAPRLLGEAGAAGLFAAFLCAFVLALCGPGRAFRLPSAAGAERGMEEAAALTHRPLAALRDSPAGEVGAETLRLWDRHITGLSRAKELLKIAPARTDVARRDPLALRHAAMMLLVVGLVVAGGAAEERLARGFSPPMPQIAARAPTALDAWIVPPAHTRLPPVFLASSQKGMATAAGPVAVPGGSTLKVRVSGETRPPRIRYAGLPRAAARAAEKSHILDLPLEESGTLRIRQGLRDLGAWSITATPDAPPEISIISTEKTPQSTLKITYRAKDDFGIVRLTGTVSAPESLPPLAGGADVVFDMPPPAQGAEGGADETSFIIDLASHIRAGEVGMLSLTATDGASHAVATERKSFVIPERIFSDPLAQAVIAERKKIATAKDEEARRAIADALAAAGRNPAAYKGEIAVFLALGSAVRRLVYDDSETAAISVQALLWDVALRLEDGGLGLAARNLSEALAKLSQALDDKNASQAELQKQMEEVGALMQQYLRAFMGEIAQRLKDGQNMPLMPPGIAQKFMKNVDISDMLRQLQQLSRGGDREAMRQMAEALKKTIDGLRPGRMAQMKPEQMKAMQALQDIDDIIKRQQKLMDDTGRLDPKAEGAEEAAEQSLLREKLGEAVRKLGEGMKDVPENLAKADQEMKESLEAFKSGRPRDSLPHQKAALAALQKGMDDAVQKMAQGMRSIMSFGFMPGGGRYGPGTDPLGRGNEEGQGQGGDIQLPEEKERRRVQEIIDELRHRSNEYQRPKVERDYLDRLLDQAN